MATVMAEWTEVISKHQAAVLNIYSLSEMSMKASCCFCSVLIDEICLARGQHQCKDHYTKLNVRTLIFEELKFNT